MIIGFIGDVHGLVYHALALTATWQAKTGKRFDHLIQLGDMAASPDPDRGGRSDQEVRCNRSGAGRFQPAAQGNGRAR